MSRSACVLYVHNLASLDKPTHPGTCVQSLVNGLGDVLFRYPFRVPAYYALILRSLTVLEGLALSADPQYKLLAQVCSVRLEC